MPATLTHSELSVATPAICRICLSISGDRFTANGFDWFHCARCSAIQKCLTPQAYCDINPSYDPGNFLDSRNRQEVEAYLGLSDKTRIISDIVAGHLNAEHSSRTFLDVGCGMGGYLLAAQQLGFKVLGFEPSHDHARVAQDLLKLPVINDYFSPEKVQGGKFDLIMLSHVIEHIFNPKEFIHTLIGVLKPGGALVVVTPNSESIVAAVAGKSWAMLKPIDHVSVICAKAYQHFELADKVEIHHRHSEYSFEFAASLLSSLKAWLTKPPGKRATATGAAKLTAPPPIRDFGLQARALRVALTVLSLPMHWLAIVTKRQACLTTVLVRKTGPEPRSGV